MSDSSVTQVFASSVIVAVEAFSTNDSLHPAWRIVRDAGGTYTIEDLNNLSNSISGFPTIQDALLELESYA